MDPPNTAILRTPEEQFKEVEHRLKNCLTTVLALIRLTSKTTNSQKEFEALLESRITALARAHELLTTSEWGATPLVEVITVMLKAYNGQPSKRFTVEGNQGVTLSSRTTEICALLFNELATNSAKYGALSTHNGSVHITWSVNTNKTPPMLTVTWRDKGGPPITRPVEQGFGTKYLEHIVRVNSGTLAMDYPKDGVLCTVCIAL